MIKLTSKIELKKENQNTEWRVLFAKIYMTKDLYPKYKELFKNLKNFDMSIIK